MPGLVCAGEGQPLGAQAISKDWKPWQLDSLPWFPSLCQLLRHYPNVSLGISWLLAGSGVPTLHRHTNHCPRMAAFCRCTGVLVIPWSVSTTRVAVRAISVGAIFHVEVGRSQGGEMDTTCSKWGSPAFLGLRGMA